MNTNSLTREKKMREKLDKLIDEMIADSDGDVSVVGRYLANYKDSCKDEEYSKVLLSALDGIKMAATWAIAEINKYEQPGEPC